MFNQRNIRRLCSLKNTIQKMHTDSKHSDDTSESVTPYDEQRDKKKIVALSQKNQTKLSSYEHDQSPQFLREIEACLNAPTTTCKVLLKNNKPIGFITYTIHLPWYKKYLKKQFPQFPSIAKPVAYIHHLAIDESYQKNGYGKKLLTTAINDCKEQNAVKIILRTTDWADRPLNLFYINHGFHSTRGGSKFSTVLEWEKTLDYSKEE